VDNDANVAALAEARVGIGAGCASLFFITLGTGIGGGIVLDGRIYHGASFDPGEIGHLCMRPDGPVCGCGRTGCLEAIASGTAMLRDARRAVAEGRPTSILRLAEGRPQGITPEVICRAALEGDRLAREIFRVASEYLGIAISSVIHLLSPEIVAVGGGISEAGPILLDPAFETARRRTLPGMAETTRVVKASLGNDAGAIGAGLLPFGPPV
jgi:glucokinase